LLRSCPFDEEKGDGVINAIFAILIALAPWHRDAETTVQRVARMTTISNASYSAAREATCSGAWETADWCKPVWDGSVIELVALHIVIGSFETHFAEHVGAGRCEKWECDHNTSRHYWQVKQGPEVSRELFSEMVGTEIVPTTRAAYAASRVLGRGLKRCKSIEGTIAFYAHSECRWQGTAPRYLAYQRVLARLRSELRQESVGDEFFTGVSARSPATRWAVLPPMLGLALNERIPSG
jgi:hypothetical protein